MISSLVDPTRLWQLLSGVVGIYMTYLCTGLIHESMIKVAYVNNTTGAEEKFEGGTTAFLTVPCLITWLGGQLAVRYQVPEAERCHVPAKKALLCATTIIISTVTYTYAIYLTTYPVVIMFRSCNILSVILVGIFCSRVTDKHLKLSQRQLIVGTLITVAIVMFKLADPTAASKDEKTTEVLGIVLLILSLFADGFLPDFQAEIKSVYKPAAIEFMTLINKWVFVLSTLLAIPLNQLVHTVSFMYYHNWFAAHLIAMGLFNTVGQMFVYRMIKQFKQHFVPFVITTRKLFSVGLSILYYGHPTNALQVIGILSVFGLVTFEFCSELYHQKQRQEVKQVESSPLAIESNEIIEENEAGGLSQEEEPTSNDDN